MDRAEPLSARATRSELLDSIRRWREDLTHVDMTRSTLGFGIASRSIGLVAALMQVAVERLVPEAVLPERPTLGHRIQALERYGPAHRMTCSEQPRRIVTRPELKRLLRLSRMRAFVTHQEDQGLSSAAEIGRMTSPEVIEFLDAVEAVARLPLFDELICVEGRPME